MVLSVVLEADRCVNKTQTDSFVSTHPARDPPRLWKRFVCLGLAGLNPPIAGTPLVPSNTSLIKPPPPFAAS